VTLSLSLTLSLSRSLTLTHPLSHPLSLSHTHTHALTHSLTRQGLGPRVSGAGAASGAKGGDAFFTLGASAAFPLPSRLLQVYLSLSPLLSSLELSDIQVYEP